MILVEKSYPISLGSFDIYFKHLLTNYIIITLLGFILLYTYWKIRLKNNSPKILLYAIPILELKYNKNEWLAYKEKEFTVKKKKRKKRNLLMFMCVFFLLVILYLSEPTVCIVLINLTGMLFMPIQIITSKEISKEINNNINCDKYLVKIYSSGLTINKCYYPYNHHYMTYNNSLKLVNLELIEENGCKLLKFSVEAQVFIPTYDGVSFDEKKIKTINIPLPKNQEINFTKIKKQLIF